MALQGGFKVGGLVILASGSGYGHGQTFNITMRSKGQGSGFTGTIGSTNGVITSATITNSGSDYSSGSWGHYTSGSWTATGGTYYAGAHESIGISDAPGHGCIIQPILVQDTSMSISDINVEKGVSYNTANSDIHDLYQDFSTISDVNRKNWNWYAGGPVTGSLPSAFHPIRFDEFYGAEYDTYGGGGCFLAGTKILMEDGLTHKNIEDVDIGDKLYSYRASYPLDFDSGDLWKAWNDTQLNGYFDSTTVYNIYYDWFDSYYHINGVLQVTYEHPLLIHRSGSYMFQTVRNLLIGDEIFKSNNTLEYVHTIDFIEEECETINLNVEDVDVFFADGYCAHNVHDK
tara:strand:+ start:597 stop:1628 length:1032 start_codon:yes stop_codon:yes gene_type:complete